MQADARQDALDEPAVDRQVNRAIRSAEPGTSKENLTREERQPFATRLATSLLRAASVVEYCAGAGIDLAAVKKAVEHDSVSFDEYVQKISAEVRRSGFEPGSPEHFAAVRMTTPPKDEWEDEPVQRSIEATARPGGRRPVTALAWLRELLRADADLAATLAPQGLTAERISAAIDEPEG